MNKNFLKKRVVGIGMGAYMRHIPQNLFKKYKILCFKANHENKKIGEKVGLYALEEHGVSIEKYSTRGILECEESQKFLKKEADCIIIQKNNIRIEHIAKKLGLNILSNSSDIRWAYENKQKFQALLNELNIKKIPGENVSKEMFLNKNFNEWNKLYGNPIVCQLPDIKKGGGASTFFINTDNDLLSFKEKLMETKFKKIQTINVSKFVTGDSVSVLCCATKHGTLVTSIQKQIIDLPSILMNNKASGVFCGHDWSASRYPAKINKQATKIATQIGNHMYQSGYKGIFGIDFMMSNTLQEIWPIECNARFTLAMPVLSELLTNQKCMPLDYYHFLEHLECSYTLDVQEVNTQYKKPKYGSQILVKNRCGKDLFLSKKLASGIYRPTKKGFAFISSSIYVKDLKDNANFILLGGNIKLGSKIRGLDHQETIAHIIFPKSVVNLDSILDFILSHYE